MSTQPPASAGPPPQDDWQRSALLAPRPSRHAVDEPSSAASATSANPTGAPDPLDVPPPLAAQPTESLAAARHASSSIPKGEGNVLGGRRLAEDRAAGARAGGNAQTSTVARRKAKARAAAEARIRQATDEKSGAKATPTVEVPDRDGEAAKAPAIVRPHRRGEAKRFFGLHVGQMMTWEAAILGAVAVHRQPPGILIPVLVVAVAAVMVTALKYRGKWLYQWLGLRLRFATRRRAHVLTDAAPAQIILGALARGGRLTSLDVDGTRIALITHATGYTAILEPTAQAAQSVRSVSARLPALTEILPPYEPGEPVVSAQIITHTVPAPSIDALEDAAANSYRELAGGSIPARRRSWITLQVMHTPEAFTAAEVETALINAVRRIERRLTKADLRVNILNPQETASDLVSLTKIGDGASGVRELNERWTHWASGPVLHMTYGIGEWPQLDESARTSFFYSLDLIPTLGTTVEVAGKRFADALDLEVAVRLTFPDLASARHGAERLQESATAAGATVRSLDGEQIFGVAASMPLGGFAA